MVAYSPAADAVFAALGDATRRAILDGLRDGTARATDIAAQFDVSRQAVAKHLRILEDAGLLRVEQRGRERHYDLQPRSLQPVEEWLASYRMFWSRKLVDLKRHVERKRRERPTRGTA